ncbi:MAG: carbon-nitrogen hydrolase family protein [Chloroflexi bacterium]|nr:carbon-nitrogen hydrolase family protein [Chloroflexota bacterium]
MNKYLYLTIAAILGLFIGGKWNLPLAAWIAPLFVLRFFRESDKAGRSFLLLWVISAIPTIISWQGATFMSKIHPLAEVGFFLLTTPLGLLPYVIDRLYYRRFGNTAWLTLVFPIANTAIDFFSASGSPFGTFGAMAYSQRDFLPAMQIVSVTGLWGVTFVMSWFASLANHFLDKKPASLSWTFAGALALILSLSLGRTLRPAQPEQTAQIAGFSLPAGKLTEVMNQFSDGNEAVISDLHADELKQIRLLAEDGTNIVVLQEGAGMGSSEQVAKLIADASALAKEKGIYIVLPTFDFGTTPAENKVHIIDPNGEIVLTHVKYGGNDFEGSLKGDGALQTIDTPYGKLSAVICWDADFPNVLKQAGEQDVDLLFIPSNDWREVKDIHAGMATFRAVENGMSIFRQTGEGVSMVTNAYGKVINRVDMFEENTSGFTGIQNVQTPIGSVNTLYPTVGDGVGNVMLLGLVGLLIGLWVTRKK